VLVYRGLLPSVSLFLSSDFLTSSGFRSFTLTSFTNIKGVQDFRENTNKYIQA
jgi:hypothetical protein